MRIGFLGAGVWGFCLARLLCSKGYEIIAWARSKQLVDSLNSTKEHPHLQKRPISGNIQFTTDLAKAVEGKDILIEAVTSQGIRPVFEEVKKLKIPSKTTIVLTSKGIDERTGHILSDVVLDILGEDFRNSIGLLSGPGFAEEISYNLPTAIVCAAYDKNVANLIVDLFTTQYFRVYPNTDVRGVAFGGALKNIIAIACGISDGLKLGAGAKAALMTRGLHEIVRLAKNEACKAETLYGLSGMGDLFLTCSSLHSRNYRFGKLLSEGSSQEDAKKSIDMVVEGIFACRAALKLSHNLKLQMPIAQAVGDILDKKISPKDAVIQLMQRSIKEENL